MLTTVLSAERLTAHMRRIVVGGEDLDDFDPSAFTDSYVKVHLPPPGADYGTDFDGEQIRASRPRAQWPRTRSITVRAWDSLTRALTLDFLVHDGGVAGPWAAAAQPGDILQLSGPGGGFTPDPEADWHLLVGDTCVLPAIAASLERIPAGAPTFVVASGDELELACPGDLQLQWVDDLQAAVEALRLPDGRGHAFVHGEAGAVRAIRRHLIRERGMAEADLSATGYWKRCATDEQWRAEKAEWKRLAEADVAA